MSIDPEVHGQGTGVVPPARNRKKRELILKTAFDLFMERGAGMAMEELAAAAGVSKQTIYNHFGSKEGLMAAMTLARVAELTEPLIAAQPGDSSADVLDRFARNYVARVLHPRSIGVMKSLLSEPRALTGFPADFYAIGPARTLQALVDWIAAETRRKRLSVPDPALAAEQFLGSLVGSRQLRQFFVGGEGPNDAETARMASVAVTTFMRAWGA